MHQCINAFETINMARVRFEAIAVDAMPCHGGIDVDASVPSPAAYLDVHVTVMSNRLRYRFRIGHVYAARNLRLFDFLDNMTRYKICSLDETMTEACAEALTLDMTTCYDHLTRRGADAQRAWLMRFYSIVVK